MLPMDTRPMTPCARGRVKVVHAGTFRRGRGRPCPRRPGLAIGAGMERVVAGPAGRRAAGRGALVWWRSRGPGHPSDVESRVGAIGEVVGAVSRGGHVDEVLSSLARQA